MDIAKDELCCGHLYYEGSYVKWWSEEVLRRMDLVEDPNLRDLTTTLFSNSFISGRETAGGFSRDNVFVLLTD